VEQIFRQVEVNYSSLKEGLSKETYSMDIEPEMEEIYKDGQELHNQLRLKLIALRKMLRNLMEETTVAVPLPDCNPGGCLEGGDKVKGASKANTTISRNES